MSGVAEVPASCPVEAGDPRNWSSRSAAAPGLLICATRTFDPKDPNDGGRDVLVAWRPGGRAWTRDLGAPAQDVRVAHGRVEVFGAGGIRALDPATGAVEDELRLDGFATPLAEVGAIWVGQVGGDLVGVDLASHPIALRWSAPRWPELSQGAQVCGDRVFVPHATRLGGPDLGSFVGRLEVWTVDPQRGVVARELAETHQGFFDAALPALTCGGAASARWIVYE